MFSERDFRGNSISLIATNCTDPETYNLRKSLNGSSFGAEKRKANSTLKETRLEGHIRKQQKECKFF